MAFTYVTGKLTSDTIRNFSSYRVTAAYQVDGKPFRAGTTASPSGDFALSLPAAGAWQAPLTLTASGPSGTTLGTLGDLAQDSPLTGLELPVAPDTAPATVTPSADPTLGALTRFTGRVITSRGDGQRAGLIAVLWGISPGGDQPHPIAVTETIAGGYIAGDWPSEILREAFARVSGGQPIPIPLDGRRIPRTILLVTDHVPDVDEGTAAPPRGPTAEELASAPEAFANDTGCCTTFTIPNRTVEEVTFQAVVRTTQPDIRGTTTRPKPPLSDALIDRLKALALNAAESPSLAAAAALPADRGIAGLARIAAITPAAATEVTVHDLATRLLTDGVDKLALEPSVLADLAREPGSVSPLRLITAHQTSLVRGVRDRITGLLPQHIGRFDLDAEHQIDWDTVPYSAQATTVAHGHLLTVKQVWRADGYSLGDLLYSLALAPGQQKLVSQLDWERRDVTSRSEHRTAFEDLATDLSHDRDVTDIVRSALQEHMDAQSRASTSATGGGIGGFIGPVVFGAAGGVSKASSSAHQASARNVAATALNQARDRTLQAASAVRGQRASVVQTARQGESVRAQTEAIANYNHCHALTIEYFEVLRHFQVSQELAAVQECLFIPFQITSFTTSKALRWRNTLQVMRVRHGGTVVDLRAKFEAMARESDNWVNADFPTGRFADDALTSITGEFWLQMDIPMPADNPDGTQNTAAWAVYTDLLTDAPANVWQQYLGGTTPDMRPNIWNTRIAPAIARRIMDHLAVQTSFDGSYWGTALPMDSTLVTPFTQNGQLLMTIRSAGTLPYFTRADVGRVRITLSGVSVPAQVRIILQSGTMHYRTDHLTTDLFEDYRIQNDLSPSDPVEIATPLSKLEKSNPREQDSKDARLLIDLLNERVEYFHRVIWLTMDPNRRYMFLDGVIAPDAGGRSVASVVDNKVIAVVGNCLVMPVVPGLQLDPTYKFARATPDDLRNLYDADPPPPMRISVPTRGVFAEAVPGKCNSCEKIDDTRYWHWDEAPIPDSPTAILPLSTDSRRRTPPSLTPSSFPDPLIAYQDVPSAPDPAGLAAALKLLGGKNLFQNLTGLALNQQNAAGALQGVMSAAQSFASQGAALAQQKFLSGQVDRNMELIKKARDNKQLSTDDAQKLTESLFKGAIGQRRPEPATVSDGDAIKRSLDRVAASESGAVRITRPGGTVEVKTGNKAVATGVNVAVAPAVVPIAQTSSMTCWAAVGTMMASWHANASLTQQTMLDDLGGSWRAKYDADQGLSTAQLRGFTAALHLREEAPASYSVEGLARLLGSVGPLWIVADDSLSDNKIVHARIVTGIKGDGTIDGTTVTMIDPIPGTTVTEVFSKFAHRFESPEAVEFGVGIYHW